MAETKPTKIPRWNDTGGNRTEPAEAKKDLGWVVDEQPPSSFFNWLSHFIGQWFKWINERFVDGLIGGGGDEEDLLIQPPTPASDGGALSLKGANGLASGDRGGDVIIEAGDAPGPLAGLGGNIDVDAGDSFGAVNPGNIDLRAGNSNDTTGTVTGGLAVIAAGSVVGSGIGVGGNFIITAGSSLGTDLLGGEAQIKSGISRGDQHSEVTIWAADKGAAGSGANIPEVYVTIGGTNFDITTKKTLNVKPGSAARGGLNIEGAATDPGLGLGPSTGGIPGEIAVRSDSGQISFFTGARAAHKGGFVAMSSRVLSMDNASSVNASNSAFRPFFDGGGDIVKSIPVNSLRVGTIIRAKAWGALLFNTSSLRDMELRLGGIAICRVNFNPATDGQWRAEFECVVRSIGATGVIVGSGFGLEIADSAFRLINLTSAAIDMTAAQDLKLGVDWLITDAGDSFTAEGINIEII